MNQFSNSLAAKLQPAVHTVIEIRKTQAAKEREALMAQKRELREREEQNERARQARMRPTRRRS